PCIGMGRRQRPKDNWVAAPRKLICFPGKFERFSVVSKCRIRISRGYPGEVIQSGNRSWRYLQCLFEFLDTIRNFSLGQQSNGKVCVHSSNIRPDRQGYPTMQNCFVNFALLQKDGAKIIMRGEVVRT